MKELIVLREHAVRDFGHGWDLMTIVIDNLWTGVLFICLVSLADLCSNIRYNTLKLQRFQSRPINTTHRKMAHPLKRNMNPPPSNLEYDSVSNSDANDDGESSKEVHLLVFLAHLTCSQTNIFHISMHPRVLR